ncbi:MAG TPA: hypothetical protein VE685_27800, partial [Thermoanaerobaculia bacterium]|nr:hypothetical protein [Thermoanaerobaculia bacterium]
GLGGLGAELRGEMVQGMDGLRGEMVQGMDGLRGEMVQGMDGLRGEMVQGMDGLREEGRLTRVLMEGIRSDVRLLAEGLVGMNDRMASHEAEMRKSLAELSYLFTPAIRHLEARDQHLEARMKILEDWADRQARDVLEVIREKFGRRQGS